MRILFIDDDHTINHFHKIILGGFDQPIEEKRFFQVPEQALDYLLIEQEGNTFPDVIFLDLNMPRMDGWEFLKAYEEKSIKRTKIIILSTSENPVHKQKAAANDLVYDFVSKPLDLEYLSTLF